jgi:type I restriction enzyme S subunit
MTPNDVKIVADNIDDFIEVPDGVSRLRKAVLTLAVSGKLVPQVAKEGIAKEFYAQIQTERLKIAKEAVRQKKQGDKSQVITKEEEPFVIPNSWQWVRFQETFFSVRGITFPGGDKSKELEEGYIPVLRSGNVQDTLDLSNLLYVPEKYVGNKNQYLKKGDIVVSMANSRELVGKSCLVGNFEGKYSFGGFLSVFRPYLISPEYFQMVFSCDFVRARFFKDAKQVINIANLSLATINLIPFPLPPLAEQKRIVKKVEEVMKQLDELEAKKRERDETRTRLARSAMRSLGQGQSKIAFEQLTEFIRTPDDLKELEGALLTLAVSGKLVSQEKKEGTAEELYSQIQIERLGRKKKAKDFIPISTEEVPFEIPTSWKWVRIREITHDCGQKAPDKDFCYVDVSSIDSSRGLITEPKYLKATEAPSRARKCVEDKSVIYSGVRPYLLNTAVVDLSAIEKEVIVSTAFFVLKPYADISSEYVHLVVRSPYFDDLANRACVGAAYPAINDDKFEKLPIPLPPLKEQQRIVKKVEEVIVLINRLKQVI